MWKLGIHNLGLFSKRLFTTSTTATTTATATTLSNVKTQYSSGLPPQVLINCLRNNICLTVNDPPGRLLFKLSGGLAGFKGAQKTSQKAALAMLDTLQERLGQLGITKIRLNFRGISSARSIIISQLRRLGLQVTEVIDTTPVPFNGCRPKKARRL